MIDLALTRIDAPGLRHAVSLSLLSGKPFRLRAGYSRITGNTTLLTLLSDWEDAIASVGAGSFENSGEDLLFTPSRITGGNYSLAGAFSSSTVEIVLLLMPALFFQSRRSSVSIEGVTHAEGFYSTDFVRETLLGLLEQMGFYAHFSLKRFGFSGSGGGRIESKVYPAEVKRYGLPVSSEGASIIGARVYFAKLDIELAMTQKVALAGKLGISHDAIGIVNIQNSLGPGFFVQVWVRHGSMEYVVCRTVDVVEGEGASGPGEVSMRRAIHDLAGECACYTGDGLLPGFLAREIALYCIMSGNKPPQYSDTAVRDTLSMCESFL